MTIEHVAKTIARGFVKESPNILFILGLTGIPTTVYLGIKATKPALYLLEKEREKRYKEGIKMEPINIVDTVKITWKCYIPTFLVGATTIGCFIGANTINMRRNAALMSLYTFTEASFKKYQEKVIEQIGKNKEEKVRDSLTQDALDEYPLLDEGQVILTGKGETLFFDEWSGRYFRSNMETIRRIQNDLNANILGGDDLATINSFYDELGLDRIKFGEENGWLSQDKHILDIQFRTKIAGRNQPCIVLEYSIYPLFA